MLYQESNSRADMHNDIALYQNVDYNIPHWHGAAELLLVEKGTVHLRVDQEEVFVPAGACALVMPNQLHAFWISAQASFWVHVFSGNQVPAFFNRVGKQVPRSPLFYCKEETRRFYRDACLSQGIMMSTAYPSRAFVKWQPSSGKISALKMKAVLYAILADFMEQAEWTDRVNNSENELFDRILNYIQQHYTENITLQSVAAAFGYELHYFCRCMKRVTGMNFRRLVNLYRVEQAQHLLETEAAAITDIATACGFECLRTFNRVFLELSGCTPTEYRRSGGRG